MQRLAKVLLVDDDKTTLFLHSQLLKQLEVAEQLLVAHNGLEALQVLAQVCDASDASAQPILVLLDVNMPVMNGIEFLEAFQQHPLAQHGQLVIVVLTTSEHSRDLARIRAYPSAVNVLTKPLSRDKLAAVLHRHFQRSLLVRVRNAATALLNQEVGTARQNSSFL